MQGLWNLSSHPLEQKSQIQYIIYDMISNDWGLLGRDAFPTKSVSGITISICNKTLDHTSICGLPFSFKLKSNLHPISQLFQRCPLLAFLLGRGLFAEDWPGSKRKLETSRESTRFDGLAREKSQQAATTVSLANLSMGCGSTRRFYAKTTM